MHTEHAGRRRQADPDNNMKNRTGVLWDFVSPNPPSSHPRNMEQEGRSKSQKVVGKSAPETTSSYGGSEYQISSQYILKNTNTTSI
jgi:hypothetical protein